MATNTELYSKIWATANELRGTMDASDFKAYVLGMLFYRHISESIAHKIEETEEDIIYADYEDEIDKETVDAIIEEVGYFLYPKQLFCNMEKNADKNENLTVELANAFRDIENGSKIVDGERVLKGCFLGMDPTSTKLGDTSERNERIAKLLHCIADFDISESEDDIFGDAFEYLMGIYAGQAGKAGGEYYTPSEVGELLAHLTTADNMNIHSVYDPTCGSGGLILKFAKVIGKDVNDIAYYGQEINASTHALSRINMLLHGVAPEDFHITCGNTLTTPAYRDVKPFDVIVSNPPYSLKWDGDKDVQLKNDDRFTPAGKLAPKSYADLAFVMHTLDYLAPTGTAGIVMFPGTLYRGNAEKAIRQYMVESNFVDAVIQLPSNLFYGTSIATSILILKKGKKDSSVLFVNAEQYMEKHKNKNKLSKQNIEDITKLYKDRADVEGIAKVVTAKDIAEADYKLTVSTYVQNNNREKIDLEKVLNDLKETEAKVASLRTRIDEIMAEIMD